MLFYKQSGNTTKATGQWKAGRGAPSNVWPGCVLQKNRAGKETKMETRSRYRTARRLLIFWTLFIGLGAVAGAAGMLIDPSGKAMGMDAMLPYFQVLPFAEVVFQDFTFSGIALLIVNGLSNLTAAGFLLANACADLTSMVFVFFAGGCYKFYNPKAFDKKLWRDMLRYCLPMIPAAISFWIINASDMFFVQAMCEDYGGRSGNYWVGLLSAGYFLPQVITILGSIFYEAWQLSAVTEEQDREVFFSKIFRIYASVLFCCVAGVIWLCRPMMHLFKAEYYDGWIFVPFLTLCSMCTCLNQFLNSIYVVYKRSTGSLVTMLCGAVLNLILNYCFILAWGPWGVTPASFLGLLLVFLLRAYSTRGLLEVDFHPGWLLLNLALVLAEIFCIMRLENWVIPVTVLTAIVCAINFREIFSMLNKLVGKFLHHKKV